MEELMELQNALSRWKALLGPDRVLDGAFAGTLYGENTLPAQRSLSGALLIHEHFELVEAVKIAFQYRVPLHPICTGRNWGYGSALPCVDGPVLVDLSRMKRIIEVNAELGYATVEPGVTQQDLYDYLQAKDIPLMVPTTGAGPTASLLGNALERGFGITPYADHFGAVLGLQAVLADGRVYQSMLKAAGGHRSDKVFGWKLGPYLEGIFAQSNFGIVSQATLALATRPERISQFIIFLHDDSFEEAVSRIGRLKRSLGEVLSGVNLMNRRRLLAMMVSPTHWNPKEVEGEVHLRQLAKAHGMPDWAVLGALYGPKEIAAGVKKRISREFSGISSKIVYLDRARINLAKRLTRWIPSLRKPLDSASLALDILEGKPSEVALPLAYLKNPRPDRSAPLHPDKDGCGLIWYAPLVPIDPSLARDFCHDVTRICIENDIDPLITLTTVTPRCFDSTIPILFDRSSPEKSRQARACYNALLKAGRSMGIFPYRLDVDAMADVLQSAESPAADLLRKMKSVFDPHDILDRGRYVR